MVLKAKRAKVVVEANTGDSSDADPVLETESPKSSDLDSHSDSDIIDEESRALLNEGWADSIAKILRTNKPKKKKTLVLSKAKKLTDPIKKVKTENYEIATADGKIKKEETLFIQQAIVHTENAHKKKKRELPNLRVKPNILEKDRERTLQKIATKGVVQLFNAVKMQQKDISKKLDEAGPLEVRKEKVLKNINKQTFLDVLMGEKSQVLDDLVGSREKSEKPMNENVLRRDSGKKEASWNVLRDDFLMSAKMKDWDKEEESGEVSDEMEVEEELESS